MQILVQLVNGEDLFWLTPPLKRTRRFCHDMFSLSGSVVGCSSRLLYLLVVGEVPYTGPSFLLEKPPITSRALGVTY